MVSTDGSIFRVGPACVVYPRNTEDVLETVNFARDRHWTIHPRGAGSGLCGSALGKGIVIDFTKYMHRLIHLDEEEKSFECEPGFRLGELEHALEGKGLFFPPDPSSGEYATFGGMYNTNASGAHSVKYGNVADYILDAQVVLSNGAVVSLSEVLAGDYEKLPSHLKKLHSLYALHAQTIETAYPDVRYNVTGYNLRGLLRDGRLDLRRLFAGSEGTLGIVTRLKFRLLDRPLYDSLVVAFFSDIVSSARAVQTLLEMGPSGIEIMDKSLLGIAGDNDERLKEKIPEGIDNVLLIEFDSEDGDTCARLASQAMDILKSKGFTDDAHLALTNEEKGRFWALRKAAVPVLYRLKGERRILPLIEDAAVPVDRLVEYVEGIYRILTRHDVAFVVYGHIAKGLLHTRPLLNLKDRHDIDLLRILADEVFELVSSLGGAISGEHGDGRLRSAYIKRQYPEIYELFLQTKQILDKDNLFNPAIKTVHDVEQMTKSLRFGKDYLSRDLREKHLLWPEDFVEEVEKCHGCSKCTTVTTATRMCPIYKVTRDESATPKSKANILRALISGVIDGKNLYERTFQNVIDKCVACGSCSQECPSHVNIPKMAIEAKAQYVRKFGTPLENRLLVSAELAGKTPKHLARILYAALELDVARKAMELCTGISAQRKPPRFSARSLFEMVRPKDDGGEIRLLYFAGCYASYVRPEIGLAALKTLKSMGMTVQIPEQHCCGLPMLSKGMVRLAKKSVNKNLRKWGDLLRDIDHIVVTCSSCGLSLMQKWAYLLQSVETEEVRGKIIHISDLINRHPDSLRVKECQLNLSYHLPCHLKIQTQPDSSMQMLYRIRGVTVEDLRSNCCGMAGTWGMSGAHYELSREIGSDMIRKLNTSPSPLGVTDCPTCRMQMEHLSDKEIKHPIEVVADYLDL